MKMSSTEISGNEITGNHLERGSINIGTKNYVFGGRVANPQALKNLIERSKELSEKDQEYRDFIEELNFLLSPRAEREIVGLEQKLIGGGRYDLIEEAVLWSNKFARRASRDQLSTSMQALYFHCLTMINSGFDHVIRPLIAEGADRPVIDAAIYREILLPLGEEVASVDISLGVNMIRGMLYFLTDKCHIRWS